ncbi:Na+:solute symporter [bacterium]|nr:Na+:solute symporter [bacterium]|tara:strand:+ start:2477 stop:4195 length:1719 start_codon:yes stop_codon:yes gene_type:complete
MSYFLFLQYLSITDLIIITFYLLLSISIGVYFNKKSQNNITSYFVSERNLPWWLLGTSMVATTLSIDTPIVIIAWIRDPGIWKNWFWWSFLFTHCLVIFFFSRYWRRAEVITDNQLIEIRYSGSPAKYLRLFKAFYFSLFFNLIISAWIISAFLKIFNVLLGFDSTGLLIIVTFVALFYSTSSGLKGIVINDFVQYFVAFAGSIILVIFLIGSEKIGGFQNYFELVQNLPREKIAMIPSIFNREDFMLFLSYSTIVWWSSHNSDGGGYIIQRLCSAKSEKDGVLGTIWFVLNHYVLRFAPWIVIGLCALILYPSNSTLIVDSEEIYPLLIRDYVDDGFRGFLIVTLLAAYMSTISTQINWGSSYLVNDLYKRFFIKDRGEGHYVFISKIFTVIFLFLALIVGLGIKNIGSAWIFLWSVSSGLGFFLIARWFWWRINSWSEISALISSIILSGTFYFFDYIGVLNISFTLKLIIIPISIFIGLVVTYLTKPEDEKVLENFYNKIRPNGFWRENKNSISESITAPLLNAFQLSLSILILIYGIIKLATGSLFFGSIAITIGLAVLVYIIKDIKE